MNPIDKTIEDMERDGRVPYYGKPNLDYHFRTQPSRFKRVVRLIKQFYHDHVSMRGLPEE